MVPVLAESYLHDFDPFAVRFWGDFGLRWYGLSYMAGFLVGWLIVVALARTRRSQMRPDMVGDLAFYMIVGVIVGGRLGYCLFYQPGLFIDPPLLGVVQLWKGGMASHGGLIGVIGAAWLFARRRGISVLHIFDVMALLSPFGLAFGRLANFVNAELWGRALPRAMQSSPPWWSVKYPEEPVTYSNLAEFWTKKLEPARELVPETGSFLQNVVDALKAGDQAVVDAVQPLLTAYYPSQLFQAFAEGPVLLLLMVIPWLPRLKPGIVGGWWLVCYGVLRVVTEVYRQPDPGVGRLWTPFGEISRGQQLSLVMIVAGVILMVQCARRKAEPVGSLLYPRREEDPDRPSA